MSFKVEREKRHVSFSLCIFARAYLEIMVENELLTSINPHLEYTYKISEWENIYHEPYNRLVRKYSSPRNPGDKMIFSSLCAESRNTILTSNIGIIT